MAGVPGPSPSSAPSTPSTHTPGDVISMPSLPHSGSSSKSIPATLRSQTCEAGAGMLEQPFAAGGTTTQLELDATCATDARKLEQPCVVGKGSNVQLELAKANFSVPKAINSEQLGHGKTKRVLRPGTSLLNNATRIFL
ncbi:uncharacterized protein LOC114916834 [Cajanus cajan]|uniref:uncharacterized protein LOC114916834 n=1 Tax=Cajanus cajan TaxID=3821 RepID=UPI0010FAF537|nr:uncharacterized protein LOC114916834 [Cajanus cajan]